MYVCLYVCLYVQGISKWLEQFQSAIRVLKTLILVSFPHGMEQQVFKFCAHVQSHSPLLSHSVTYQSDNGDSGAESVLCAAICKTRISCFCVAGILATV